MKSVRMPSQKEFLAIGCKIGQDVIPQIVVENGVSSWMYVYDAKTEKLIGKIELKEEAEKK